MQTKDREIATLRMLDKSTLRMYCSQYGLSIDGNKEQLAERIVDHREKQIKEFAEIVESDYKDLLERLFVKFYINDNGDMECGIIEGYICDDSLEKESVPILKKLKDKIK